MRRRFCLLVVSAALLITGASAGIPPDAILTSPVRAPASMLPTDPDRAVHLQAGSPQIDYLYEEHCDGTFENGHC